jgi:diguanylate cyclase (GGDEF)-like protein
LRLCSTTTLKSLVVPGGVLLLGVMALVYSGWVTLALPALSFLQYCALLGGMVLAWRFHSSRIFFSLLVIFLADEAVALLGGGRLSLIVTTVRTVAVLVPINFVLLALMHERGFTAASTAPVGLALFAQSVIVVVYCHAAGGPVPIHPHYARAAISFPGYALLVFAATAIILFTRFLRSRKPVDSGLLWSMSAFLLSLRFAENTRVATLYSATAASILGASIIESSYLLAYHDELTTLPSRRAFNDALLRLTPPYSIAVIDIDHFKKFNDTYGHDIGDQVLQLVASNLARVTGGGQAYRCGGEEFTIVFPGKRTPEVVEHLERLREAIESSEFRRRGGDRRQSSRGADRRKERSRSRKGHVIRQLAQDQSAEPLSVTVSIGVATSGATSDPEAVVQAADKALYRAKNNGRNRIEAASVRSGPSYFTEA